VKIRSTDVKDALAEIGIVGLNMFEVRGHGRQGGIQLVGRAGTYQVNMLPKIQVNIVLSDRNLEDAIEAILKSAYTGEPGRRHYLCISRGRGDPCPDPRTGTGCHDVSRRY